MPRSVHPGTPPHSPEILTNRGESPSRPWMAVTQSGVVYIRLWATPHRLVLRRTHKSGIEAQ